MLTSNPNLTRWDVACMLTKEFRNYFCCCCILEACVDKNFARVCHHKYCRNGHKFICKQQYCIAHNKRLTVCRLCPDPRAGSSYHRCGVLRSKKCNCRVEDHLLLGINPQEKEVIDAKESYAVAILDRARDMAHHHHRISSSSSSSYSSALMASNLETESDSDCNKTESDSPTSDC